MAASALPPSVPATPAPPIVHRAAAVVEWIDLEVEPRCSRYLTGLKPASVTFSLLYSEQQHEAALFIRVLLQQWTERKKEEQVYILIDLSNIILLMQDLEHSIPEKSTAAVLDGPTTCLRLVLHRPVSIVGSSDLALQSSELLGSLELLARQTILAIHIPLSRVSNMEALQQICRAITGGSLRQDRRSIEGLCRGNAVTIIGRQGRYPPGGNKRRREDNDDNDDHHVTTPLPPPYPAARLSPLLPATQKSPEEMQKKHLQEYGIDTAGRMSITAVAGIFAEFLAQQKADIGTFLSRQQAHMDKTLTRIDKEVQDMEVRITEKLKRHLGDELQDCEQHIGNLVRDNTAALRHELEEVVEKSVEYNLDLGDDYWEDLKDEIRQACLDELKDDLEGGLVSIILPR